MEMTSTSSGVRLSGTHWSWREQPIYYVQAGERRSYPPLLLIHGFGASTYHWYKNIAELSQDFEVWAIDLLGFGRSAKPNWQYSADLWRDQLYDFITEVIGEPVVLAGNSLGGYAALCVSAQRPSSSRGLVLINSAGSFTDTHTTKPDPIRQVVSRIFQGLFHQPFASFLLFQYMRQPGMIRQVLEKVYLDHSAITEQLVEDIHRATCDPGAPEVFASVFKTPQGEKVDRLLQKLACPLLILWGEADPWMNCRERGTKFRQHYPQLTDHYLRAGHCPHDEIPSQVNQLIRDWILLNH